MPRERILITVKTYPTLSRTYGETVCTAGVRGDGSWIRLYPVPFRRLEEKEQYRKYDWIECDVVRSTKDPRPETFHPVDPRQMLPVDHIGTEDKWRARRRLLLEKARVDTCRESIIAAAKANQTSLTVFKPARIIDFRWEREEREWDPAKLAEMRNKTLQGELFDEDAWRQTFQVLPKLPYSFSYRFEDDAGKRSEMQVLDWEAGALFWKCFRKSGSEEEALVKVRQRYFEEFVAKDTHFFLGTTQQFHFVGKNPWVIVGVFYPPVDPQMELL